MASSAALIRSRGGSKASQPSSSGQFWSCQKQTRALLSIKKPYADAIFRGEKLFEFRRSVFRKAVDVVIIYVTSPTCQVAGEFDVSDVISESVEDLWVRTSRHAGIDRDGFFSYFEGREIAHAIVIGPTQRRNRSHRIDLNS